MKDDDGKGGDDQHEDNNCEKEKIFLQTLYPPGFSFVIKKKQIFLQALSPSGFSYMVDVEVSETGCLLQNDFSLESCQPEVEIRNVKIE